MADTVRNGPDVLARIKARTSKKMVGYFFPVVPEELIYAAGLHPVQIYPLLQEMITEADAHLQSYLCSYVRATWDQVIKGKASYLDGIIIPRSCEAVTFLYQTWKRNNPLPFTEYLNVPWKKSENTILFFTKELERVKNHLETFTGKRISSESLEKAIALYNRHRSLMRKVYDLQKADFPPLSGLETLQMAMSGFLLDKEEHSQLLEEALTEIEQRSAPLESPVRLLLSGGCVIDVRLWEMIESRGASIVANDVANGARAFSHTVEEGQDPLASLARAYISVPCAFNTSVADRFAFVSAAIKSHGIKGVIFAINRNCETEKFDYPELSRKIKEKLGIPTFLIETDYMSNMEPLRTRIEAFIEMLQDEGE